MFKHMLIVVMSVACLACLASAVVSPRPRSSARALLADQTVNGCLWAADACKANPQYALSLIATDDKARVAQKIAAMDYTCSTRTANTTCEEDWANQCSWNPTTATCYMMTTDDGWRSALTCPGSKAAQVNTCLVGMQSEAGCTKITGCNWVIATTADLALLQSMEDAATAFSATRRLFTLPSRTADNSSMYCIPSGMSMQSYFNETGPGTWQKFDAAYWGTCASVNQLKFIETSCTDKNETQCNAANSCTYNPEVQYACFMPPDSQLQYLFTSSAAESDFDKKMEALFAACAAATNETACTSVGATNQAKFDEAVATTALLGSQTAVSKTNDASAASAALHLMLATIAVFLILMA